MRVALARGPVTHLPKQAFEKCFVFVSMARELSTATNALSCCVQIRRKSIHVAACITDARIIPSYSYAAQGFLGKKTNHSCCMHGTARLKNYSTPPRIFLASKKHWGPGDVTQLPTASHPLIICGCCARPVSSSVGEA